MFLSLLDSRWFRVRQPLCVSQAKHKAALSELHDQVLLLQKQLNETNYAYSTSTEAMSTQSVAHAAEITSMTQQLSAAEAEATRMAEELKQAHVRMTCSPEV